MIRVAPHIADAIMTGQPVVALETSVIAHGLPRPTNLEVGKKAQDVIRRGGAHPATIGIVAGQPTIGLSDEEIELFARREGIIKTNISNLAWVVTRQAWGATTVSASLRLARRSGIKVFATGGIGGVHRNVGESFDISSDLTALADTAMIVVCSGAKTILDLPKTFEYLETIGAPVIGYRTDQFPAFFSRSGGITLPMTASMAEEVVNLCRAHWATGNPSAVIVASPVPPDAEVPQADIEAAISKALAEAERANIVGKEITPFVLAHVEKMTAGRSLKANIALILNNVDLAAELSREWAKTSSP